MMKRLPVFMAVVLLCLSACSEPEWEYSDSPDPIDPYPEYTTSATLSFKNPESLIEYPENEGFPSFKITAYDDYRVHVYYGRISIVKGEDRTPDEEDVGIFITDFDGWDYEYKDAKEIWEIEEDVKRGQGFSFECTDVDGNPMVEKVIPVENSQYFMVAWVFKDYAEDFDEHIQVEVVND